MSNIPRNTYECRECGRTFPTERGRRHHLSQVHDKDTLITVECSWCGEEKKVEPWQYEKNEEFFCDRDGGCQSKWKQENASGENHPRWKKKVKLTCKVCGDSYTRSPSVAEQSVVCGEECGYTYLSREYSGEDNPQYDRIEKECVVCGDSYFVIPSREERRSTCGDEECIRENLSENYRGENAPNWKGGHTNYYGPNWLEQRQKARERDDYTCQYCGGDLTHQEKEPDVHHIKRLMWFKQNYDEPEWYERGNRLGNLVTACRDCHRNWEGVPVTPELD